jgi:uncharacterized protein (TIGR04562 family)
MTIKARALRSLFNGISILDLPKLEITSLEEAESFLKSYGIDVNDPPQWDYVKSLYKRARYFLFEFLLNRRDLDAGLPKELTQFSDLGKLLMQASRNAEVAEARVKTLWTCALLRICHALFHLQYDWRNRYLQLAEPQVMAPIAQLIHRDGEMGKWLGKPNAPGSFRIMDFVYRLEKPFESLLMKLIHKPQVVATDVYDRVACRFVTYRRVDALRVVQFLLNRNVINVAHLVPSRSRNTLFDVDSALMLLADWDGTSEVFLDRIEEQLTAPAPSVSENQVSSDQYRACHLTLRHLVHIPDERKGAYHFFLPFELQIMDKTSYEDSVMGYSSHDNYKATQRDYVIRRILREELYDRVVVKKEI